MKDTEMNRIKMILQEEDAPYFTDTQIEFYVQENGGNIDAAIYQMLIVKSESSVISVSGLSTQDTSSYFKRLAAKYKPRNSGILKGWVDELKIWKSKIEERIK